MPNTIESVKMLILNAVEKATGWTSVFGPVQGPEPANQYCIVTITDHRKQQHDVITWTGTDQEPLTENQRQEGTLEFEIQARGRGAISAINKLTAYMDSELRDLDLWPYVGSGGHDEAQNITTEYHQGKIMEVALVKIYIHTTLPVRNTLEYMNYVDINIKRSDNVDVATITTPKQEN